MNKTGSLPAVVTLDCLRGKCCPVVESLDDRSLRFTDEGQTITLSAVEAGRIAQVTGLSAVLVSCDVVLDDGLDVDGPRWRVGVDGEGALTRGDQRIVFKPESVTHLGTYLKERGY